MKFPLECSTQYLTIERIEYMLYEKRNFGRCSSSLLTVVKPGFHMIATVASRIDRAEKHRRSLGYIKRYRYDRHHRWKWFPYDCYDRYNRWDRIFLAQRSRSLRSLRSLQSLLSPNRVVSIWSLWSPKHETGDRSDHTETSL